MAFNFSDADVDEIENNADDESIYIRDSNKGLELISKILPSYNNYCSDHSKNSSIQNIKNLLSKRIWKTQKHVATDIIQSEQLIEKLVSQLEESKKIKLLQGKSIIGMGGKFSAGKSGFINSILNQKEQISLLKEDQNPTTSIPTYLTFGTSQEIKAYCGTRVLPMDIEAMQAITYGFYRKYKIGFSRYINSIAIHTNTFPPKLKDKVVLLDTPGYNNAKEDETSNLTDREVALNQLKVADFIIWVIDIDSGVVESDDLAFIRELDNQIPILFVFAKADKRTDEQIKNIVTEAEKILKNTGINVYGVTAYSSIYAKEYLGRNLLDAFLRMAVANNNRKNDLDIEIDKLINDLYQNLQLKQEKYLEQRKQIAHSIHDTDEIYPLKLISKKYRDVSSSLKNINDNILEFESLMMNLKEDLLNMHMYENCVKIQSIIKNIKTRKNR